ncbi:MAG: hypothetical protein KDK66_03280 [Deltaproteobacteria bacterium]|nr:hypothetical protein [Deltaproteobacteria bacterium]
MKKKLILFVFAGSLLSLLSTKPSLAFEDLKLAPSPTPILEGRFSLNLPMGLKRAYPASSLYEVFTWQKGPHAIQLFFEEKFTRLNPKEENQAILLLEANRNKGGERFEIKKIQSPQNWQVYLMSQKSLPKTLSSTNFKIEIVDSQQLHIAAYAIIKSDNAKNFNQLSELLEKAFKTITPGKALELKEREEVLDLIFSEEKIRVKVPKDFYLVKMKGAQKGKEEYIIAPIKNLSLKGKIPSQETSLRLIAYQQGDPGWDLKKGNKQVTKKLFGKEYPWWVSQKSDLYYQQTQYPGKTKIDETLPYFHLILQAGTPSFLQDLEKIVDTMELYEN